MGIKKYWELDVKKGDKISEIDLKDVFYTELFCNAWVLFFFEI